MSTSHCQSSFCSTLTPWKILLLEQGAYLYILSSLFWFSAVEDNLCNYPQESQHMHLVNLGGQSIENSSELVLFQQCLLTHSQMAWNENSACRASKKIMNHCHRDRDIDCLALLCSDYYPPPAAEQRDLHLTCVLPDLIIFVFAWVCVCVCTQTVSTQCFQLLPTLSEYNLPGFIFHS